MFINVKYLGAKYSLLSEMESERCDALDFFAVFPASNRRSWK